MPLLLANSVSPTTILSSWVRPHRDPDVQYVSGAALRNIYIYSLIVPTQRRQTVKGRSVYLFYALLTRNCFVNNKRISKAQHKQTFEVPKNMKMCLTNLLRSSHEAFYFLAPFWIVLYKFTQWLLVMFAIFLTVTVGSNRSRFIFNDDIENNRCSYQYAQQPFVLGRFLELDRSAILQQVYLVFFFGLNLFQ